jgi:hypothetical protein
MRSLSPIKLSLNNRMFCVSCKYIGLITKKKLICPLRGQISFFLVLVVKTGMVGLEPTQIDLEDRCPSIRRHSQIKIESGLCPLSIFKASALLHITTLFQDEHKIRHTFCQNSRRQGSEADRVYGRACHRR